MDFFFRVLICHSLLTCFLLLFQANVCAYHWISNTMRRSDQSCMYSCHLHWQCLAVGAKGGKAQDTEKSPEAPRVAELDLLRVRWAQSLASLPHRPGQNWCLVWGHMPLTPRYATLSALVFNSCSVSGSGMWLAGHRISKSGDNS